MFSVGEYIVYGVEGVCRVEEAGKLKVAGLDKNARITVCARIITTARSTRRSTGRPSCGLF